MALLTTNLKGRNVSLKRIDKPETTSAIAEIAGNKTFHETELNNVNKERKIITKDSKKIRKTTIQIMDSGVGLSNEINNFFFYLGQGYTSSEPINVFLDNDGNPTATSIGKLEGFSSNDALLTKLITDLRDTNVNRVELLPVTTVVMSKPLETDVNINFFGTGGLQEATDNRFAIAGNINELVKLGTDLNTNTSKRTSEESKLSEISASQSIVSQQSVSTLPAITLVGVQKISIQNSSTVGQESGLVTPFLQGWYNNPIKIEVTGKSYLGAFEKLLPFFPETGDTTKDDLNNLFLDNDRIFRQNLSLEIELKIENEGVYEGLISDFNYDEDINEPFMINYSITYIGFRNAEKSKINGEKRSKLDLSAALNIVPGSKGLNFLLSSITPKL